MTRPAGLALAVGLGLALGATALTTGCGGDDDGATGPASQPSPTTAGSPDPMEPAQPPTTVGSDPTPPSTPPPTAGQSPTTPLPTVGHPDGPPRSPTDQVKPRTLTGTVATAAGCLVLDTGAGRWALVGGTLPADLAAGDRVEVTARPMPQAESPCGSPVLSVLALTRL